jgi:hypothetical protein
LEEKKYQKGQKMKIFSSYHRTTMGMHGINLKQICVILETGQNTLYHDGHHRTTMRHHGTMQSYRATMVRKIQAHFTYK